MEADILRTTAGFLFFFLPFVVSAGLQLATRRVVLASLCGALILPTITLILVALPGPQNRGWPIALLLSFLWGSITGPFGAAVVTALTWALQRMEERREPLNF